MSTYDGQPTYSRHMCEIYRETHEALRDKDFGVLQAEVDRTFTLFEHQVNVMGTHTYIPYQIVIAHQDTTFGAGKNGRVRLLYLNEGLGEKANIAVERPVPPTTSELEVLLGRAPGTISTTESKNWAPVWIRTDGQDIYLAHHQRIEWFPVGLSARYYHRFWLSKYSGVGGHVFTDSIFDWMTPFNGLTEQTHQPTFSNVFFPRFPVDLALTKLGDEAPRLFFTMWDEQKFVGTSDTTGKFLVESTDSANLLDATPYSGLGLNGPAHNFREGSLYSIFNGRQDRLRCCSPGVYKRYPGPGVESPLLFERVRGLYYNHILDTAITDSSTVSDRSRIQDHNGSFKQTVLVPGGNGFTLDSEGNVVELSGGGFLLGIMPVGGVHRLYSGHDLAFGAGPTVVQRHIPIQDLPNFYPTFYGHVKPAPPNSNHFHGADDGWGGVPLNLFPEDNALSDIGASQHQQDIIEARNSLVLVFTGFLGIRLYNPETLDQYQGFTHAAHPRNPFWVAFEDIWEPYGFGWHSVIKLPHLIPDDVWVWPLDIYDIPPHRDDWQPFPNKTDKLPLLKQTSMTPLKGIYLDHLRRMLDVIKNALTNGLETADPC